MLLRNAQSRGEGGTVVNNAMLQVVLQAVSALAVAEGLVYAALQFRGWRTAQHVANFTTLVELQLEAIRKPFRTAATRSSSLLAVMKLGATAGSESVEHK